MSELEAYFYHKSVEITEKLITRDRCDLGLLGGELGWCIFLKETEIPNKDEYIKALLEKQIECINTSADLPYYNIHKGLGSLYLSIYYLGLEYLLSKSQLDQLHQWLLKYYEGLIELENYDYLYGCSGLFSAFLKSGKCTDVIVSKFVEGLRRILEKNTYVDIKSARSGIVAFGFAHGVCAVSQLLIQAGKLSFETERINELLYAIGDALIDRFHSDASKRIVVPTGIERDGNFIYTEVIGWCTGRLCYGVALLYISEATGNSKYELIANEILNDSIIGTAPELDQRLLKDPTKAFNILSLCHGIPSRSILLKIAYEKTRNERYQKLHNLNQRILVETFYNNDELIEQYKNNHSLLQGISGIFLTILFNNRKKWQELLLLF